MTVFCSGGSKDVELKEEPIREVPTFCDEITTVVRGKVLIRGDGFVKVVCEDTETKGDNMDATDVENSKSDNEPENANSKKNVGKKGKSVKTKKAVEETKTEKPKENKRNKRPLRETKEEVAVVQKKGKQSDSSEIKQKVKKIAAKKGKKSRKV